MARILLAETDVGLRPVLARRLRFAGYEVDEVDSGAAVACALDSAAYDVVVADLVLPGFDGLDLARRIAAGEAAQRVVFISGFAAVGVHPDRRGPNNVSLLTRPFHLSDLHHRLPALLAAEGPNVRERIMFAHGSLNPGLNPGNSPATIPPCSLLGGVTLGT